RYDESGKKTSNPRITVRHNGVVIHDNLEIAKSTPGYHAEGPGPDSLFLQNHGNPVVFRNVWVVEKK
ncbi:MAG: family 16 glycoside hydrolase, partial [Pirellulaceae bacterium]